MIFSWVSVDYINQIFKFFWHTEFMVRILIWSTKVRSFEFNQTQISAMNSIGPNLSGVGWSEPTRLIQLDQHRSNRPHPAGRPNITGTAQSKRHEPLRSELIQLVPTFYPTFTRPDPESSRSGNWVEPIIKLLAKLVQWTHVARELPNQLRSFPHAHGVACTIL